MKRKEAEQAMRSTPGSSASSCPLCQLMPPSSCPISVLVLTSLDEEQQYGSISQRNPFFVNLLLGHGVLLLTKTVHITLEKY